MRRTDFSPFVFRKACGHRLVNAAHRGSPSSRPQLPAVSSLPAALAGEIPGARRGRFFDRAGTRLASAPGVGAVRLPFSVACPNRRRLLPMHAAFPPQSSLPRSPQTKGVTGYKKKKPIETMRRNSARFASKGFCLFRPPPSWNSSHGQLNFAGAGITPNSTKVSVSQIRTAQRHVLRRPSIVAEVAAVGAG